MTKLEDLIKNSPDSQLRDEIARGVAKLKAEYEKKLGVFLPLKQWLARTGWLIDLVVYALYGPPVEEMVVVEGKR